MYSCTYVRLLNNSLKINHHPAQSSTCIFSNNANNNFDQPKKKIPELEAVIMLGGKKSLIMLLRVQKIRETRFQCQKKNKPDPILLGM